MRESPIKLEPDVSLPSLEYFNRSIERERAARRAKGRSDVLGPDIIHFLALIAQKKGKNARTA